MLCDEWRHCRIAARLLLVARSQQWGRTLADCSESDKDYLENLYSIDEARLKRFEDSSLRKSRGIYLVCLLLFIAGQFAWRAHRSGSFQTDLVVRDLLHAALLATFFMSAVMSYTFSYGYKSRLVAASLVYTIIRFTTIGIFLGAAGAFWGAVYAGMLTWSLGPTNTSLGNHLGADLTNGAIAGTFIACAYVALNISPLALALGARDVRFPHLRWRRNLRVMSIIGPIIAIAYITVILAALVLGPLVLLRGYRQWWVVTFYAIAAVGSIGGSISHYLDGRRNRTS